MSNKTDRIICQYDYLLDFDQQDFIEKNYKKLDLLELTQEAHSEKGINEHDPEYDRVRKFVAKLERNIPVPELTDDQEEFIRNNAPRMRPIEIAKTIFNDLSIKPLTTKHKTVDKYIKALNLGNPDYGDDHAKKVYVPPKADSKIVSKINEEDINADYQLKKLTSQQKKNVSALRGYLHSKRFMSTINAIQRDSHRHIFESTFIQSTYDKCDLNAEELNMYISLCRDYVFSAQVQEQMEDINNEISSQVSGDSEEAANLKMGFVETYSNKSDEYHKIQARMEKLQINLSNKRTSRLEATADVNNSLTNFVEIWKDEEDRKKTLIIAAAKNLELKEEIKRIDSVPEYVAHVMGTSPEEVLEN